MTNINTPEIQALVDYLKSHVAIITDIDVAAVTDPEWLAHANCDRAITLNVHMTFQSPTQPGSIFFGVPAALYDDPAMYPLVLQNLYNLMNAKPGTMNYEDLRN